MFWPEAKLTCCPRRRGWRQPMVRRKVSFKFVGSFISNVLFYNHIIYNTNSPIVELIVGDAHMVFFVLLSLLHTAALLSSIGMINILYVCMFIILCAVFLNWWVLTHFWVAAVSLPFFFLSDFKKYCYTDKWCHLFCSTTIQINKCNHLLSRLERK